MDMRMGRPAKERTCEDVSRGSTNEAPNCEMMGSFTEEWNCEDVSRNSNTEAKNSEDRALH